MIGMTIAVLGSMALANLGWPSISYPPVIFCLFDRRSSISKAAGSFFYPIADDPLVIFCLGALANQWDLLPGSLYPQRTARQVPSGFAKVIEVILNCLFLLVVFSSPLLCCGLPTWLPILMRRPSSWRTHGWRCLSIWRSSTSLYGNIVTLAIIVAMITLAERGKEDACIDRDGDAFFLNIAGGSRAQLVFLTVSLVCVDWIRKGQSDGNS